jgi:hypothetical protein
VKRESHKARLLALLADGRRHHMSELIKVGGYRYGARLYDLRREGVDVETIRIGDDEFAYRMNEQQGRLAL